MVVVAIVVVAAVVVAVAGWLLAARGRRADGVDSFRRQIDALSAEARRSTVDQVKERGTARPTGDPEADAADADTDTDGGAHGA